MKPLSCLFGVHDWMLKVNPQRIWLQCASCPRESPGWSLDVRSIRNSSAISSRGNGSRGWLGSRVVGIRRLG